MPFHSDGRLWECESSVHHLRSGWWFRIPGFVKQPTFSFAFVGRTGVCDASAGACANHDICVAISHEPSTEFRLIVTVLDTGRDTIKFRHHASSIIPHCIRSIEHLLVWVIVGILRLGCIESPCLRFEFQ
jgi:hypothetical protein